MCQQVLLGQSLPSLQTFQLVLETKLGIRIKIAKLSTPKPSKASITVEVVAAEEVPSGREKRTSENGIATGIETGTAIGIGNVHGTEIAIGTATRTATETADGKAAAIATRTRIGLTMIATKNGERINTQMRSRVAAGECSFAIVHSQCLLTVLQEAPQLE